MRKGDVGLRSPPSRATGALPSNSICTINMNKYSLLSNKAGKENYCRVKLFKRDIIVRALLDSGNSFGSLISEDFRQKAGLKMASFDTPEVGSVNVGEDVQILGKTEPFSIFIENIRKRMTIQPYVARGVRHALNLSNEFLCVEEIDAKYRVGGTVFSHKGDAVTLISKRDPLLSAKFIDHRFKRVTDKLHHIPLTRFWMTYYGHLAGGGHETQTRPNHNWQGDIYAVGKQEVPAASMRFINITVPANVDATGEILVEPELKDGSINQQGLLVCKGVYPLLQNLGKILVMNPGPEAIQIEGQTKLGTATNEYQLEPKDNGEVSELSHIKPNRLTGAEKLERRRFIEKELKIKENKIL